MTICFEKDWKTEEGQWRAMPHYTTKNASFLRTCSLIQKMGIKNCYFPLALYDPDLLHIDVHNDLNENTPENEILRTKVMTEARINGWYFLREVIRIYEQGGEPIPFRLDRGNMAMAWCFFNGIDYMGMQPRQTGKDQPFYSMVRTPTGWTKMGDIEIGSQVVTPDGGTANVIGVYPQGKKDVYRVYFSDGRWTDCGDEHLWKVYNRQWSPNGSQWRVLPLSEIRESLQLGSSAETRFFIPLPEPEEKADIALPLDPYLLGVLLGDGCLTRDTPSFSSADQFVVDEVSRLLPDNLQVVYSQQYDYYISRVDKFKTKTNPLVDILSELGLLGHRSYTKFIPSLYMDASSSQKLSLLQGLLDTDGSVCRTGSISLCTTSLTMADQVQELVRSLGGICKIKTKESNYTYNGERKKGRLAYIVRIRMRTPKSLFRLPRKIAQVSGSYKSAETLKLGITGVEYVGQTETQCIEVNHPDHLYITDDYVVTHNTVCALALTGAWIIYCSGLEFEVGMMAKDNSLRQDNVKRVKAFAENLPKWWIAEDKNKDKNNMEELSYAALRTHYKTFVAQKDPSQADLQARGASPPVFHFDEFEYIVNIDVSYPTIIASTGTARENAKKNGKPYSNIITSTAGDPKKKECQEAARILDSAMPFGEYLYDLKDNDELHRVVQASSKQKMIIGVFSHLQLGKSDEWLRDKINRTGARPEQVLRDFLNRRVSIQDAPIISQGVLAQINSSFEEYVYPQIVASNYVITWYVSKATVESEAFKQKTVIVGCDSSEMIDRDATTLVGVDPETLATIFTFRCNEGNINTVAMLIAQLLLLFPKFVWVPENKSSGTSMLDIVSLALRRAKHNPFTRIFNWVVQNRHEEPYSRIDIRNPDLLDSAVKKYFGIKTDKSKREELYKDVLFEATSKAAPYIKDKTLIGELNSLTNRKGRVDHAVGGHDDTVIAWLMACWFIFNGRHLDVYGINPKTVLSRIVPGAPDQNMLDEQKRQIVMQKIEALERAYHNQPDPSLKLMLKVDIDLLKQMLGTAPVLLPTTADEVTRDPSRFTDPNQITPRRPSVSADTATANLRLLMGLPS